MNEQTLTHQNVMQILELVRMAPEVRELRLRIGEFEIELRKDAQRETRARPVSMQEIPQAQALPPSPVRDAPSKPLTVHAPVPVPVPEAPSGFQVRSPMVGTCYQSPEPGAKPFVAVGDQVAADTPLCIVEVMKLMNTVSAAKAGVVKAIHFTDGQAVEYGQLLVTIEVS